MRGFLIELKSEYEQITRNQIGRLDPGLSCCEVISACKKITENIRLLRSHIEMLLKESLYPMLDNINNISAEDEADLFSTVQEISSYESRLDPGLALMIYQRLLERAREQKDDDKILKYLYWCGITLFFFHEEQEEKILAYFEEGASYAKKYNLIGDPETRKYIHRCLGNKSMMLYSIDQQKAFESDELSFSFWNGLMFAGKDPDFPWINYFFSCLSHRYASITQKAHSDPDSETKEMLQKILDTAMSINKLYLKNRELFSLFGSTRYEFILWEAQFLSGLISFEQLRENIRRVQAETLPDDYSENAMFIRIHLDSYLMFYATKMKKLKDIREDVINSSMKNIIDYFSFIPMTVRPRDVNEHLQLFVTNLRGIFRPAEQLDFILKMTTFRHIPTYAHSITVGKIASCLTEFLAAENPACFVGCMDITQPEEVRGRLKELCGFAETAGLCHDIGKLTFVSNPYMHARILTEDELEIVKMHPADGHKMMERSDGATLHEGYSDIILGHHKYFDNSGGYPEDFDITKSKYKVMIDIISAADAIDSATDDIGKTYAETKSLETVCAEIRAGAGRRYSPVVADLLGNNAVAASLSRILNEERRDAYYAAYLHAWS